MFKNHDNSIFNSKSYINIYIAVTLQNDMETRFYLKDSNDNFKKFDSGKVLEKLLKRHESEIESYAKEQSIDLQSKKMLTYCEIRL